MVKEGLFDRLTPTQKKYIIMRNEWGMSLDEIARQTGSPKSSIKVTISNARRLMLEKIKEEL
jgi:DNA-directed RNA polymerase specialized sigma24 family protein